MSKKEAKRYKKASEEERLSDFSEYDDGNAKTVGIHLYLSKLFV